MTKEEINLAFENRWRIKGKFGQMNQNSATMSFDEFFEYIKGLCKDFFETGILLAEKASPSGQENPTIEVVCHDFDYWWGLYDLKVGKENCQKKWAKMSVKDREACIAGTPAYVSATPNKQFRKRPLTFLNQKAWKDEIIPQNNGTKIAFDEQRLNKLADILTD